MILIADSGSTKTDWCVVEQDQVRGRIRTPGINPVFQTEEEIATQVRDTLLSELPTREFDGIYFYGAGCALPDRVEAVHHVLSQHLTAHRPIEVGTDMLAAARSLCGSRPGIACILGTGSNSCYYDGGQIAANVSPLGFILGDEGSGAVLGKLLVADLLKGQLPDHLRQEFLAQWGLTPGEIIDRVYRQPFPNRFLASLSPFVRQHLDHPEVRTLARGSFRAFLQRNVMQYDYEHHPAHFIGSVAFHYRALLEEAARELGVRIGCIAQSPMEGLVRFHSSTSIL